MSKFKVGDKVKIVNPMSICERYRNTIHMVTDVDDTYVYLDIADDNQYCVKYCDHELELVEEPDLYGQPVFSIGELEKEWQKLAKHSYTGKYGVNQPTFEYIDDYMDTSKRIVVDSLYPNIIDTKTWKNAYDKYINGIWEKEEEKDMNKVVDLWYSRKKENIYKKYKDLEDKYVKEHYEIVKQYNELIEDFEKNLEDFCTEYSDITVNDDFVICKNADCNVYKYVIDESVIRNDAKVTYKEDKNKEYKELQLKYEDLNALLSMSDDLEYQQSILIEYGIINKKTKRMINESNFD